MQEINELNRIISSKIRGYDSFNIINKDKVILYGAGSLGQMGINLLSKIDVRPKYIIDQKVSGSLENINILKPKDIISSDLVEFTFIICISSIEFIPIYNYLQNLGCKKIVQFYDYAEVFFKGTLGNGWAYFNPTPENINEIKKVCEYLEHDKYSLSHYLQFLWWRLRRVEKIYDNYPVLSNKKYFKAPCIPKLTDNEVFLDGGAHFGTTIESFIKATNGNFKSVYAIEPDDDNMNILKKKIEKKYLDKTVCLDIALSNKDEEVCFVDKLGFASKIDDAGTQKVISKKIDSLNIEPTIIKFHLEGHELKALEGAKETIKKCRPILMVLADHNEDGLYKIANLLNNLEEYKLYFYLHDYCGNSATFYAIPKERK